MTTSHHTSPHPRAVRRFLQLSIAFAVIYGLWAAILSYRVVVHQQAVRQHLWFALHARPRGHFPSHNAALQVAAQWVAALNAVYPSNPCGPGPAFRLAGPTGHGAGRACTITVSVPHRRIVVQGYDTQGHRMDNVFQSLNPPPRRL